MTGFGPFEHVGSAGCGCGLCGTRDAGMPRRSFLALGAAAGIAGAGALAAGPARAQTTLNPDEALARLMVGNGRYVRGDMTSFKLDLAALRAKTVDKQEPFAAVLACADSRVPVEIIFDESIGSIFVCRVAGNIANTETIASLEYGAEVLKVPAIMVLAHQNCGAVDAAMHAKNVPGQISALYPPLQPAVDGGGHDLAATAKLNAKIQAQLLSTASTVLARRIADRQLKIVAGYYELGSGRVMPV